MDGDFFGLIGLFILVVVLAFVWDMWVRQKTIEHELALARVKGTVMIPCEHCGVSMPQTSVFCPNCGVRRKG